MSSMRLLASFVLVVACLGSAACTAIPAIPVGSAPTVASSDAGGSAAPAPLTLRFMHWQESTVPGTPWWDAIVAGFEGKHPGVKVETQFVTFDQYLTTLETLIAAQDLPDVFFSNPKTIQLGRAGRVVDFSKVLPAEYFARFYPGPLRQTTAVDGGIYGLPLTAQMFAFFVNPRIMNELGLKPPVTWNDLIAMTPEIRAAGYVPLAWGSAFGGTCGDFFLPLIAQYGGDVYGLDDLSGAGVTWNSDPVIRALALMQKLAKAGVFEDGINSVTEAQARQLAYQGRAAMMFNESSLPAVIPFEAPADYARSYYVAKVPALTPEGIHWAGDGTGESIAVNNDSANRDLAIEFVKHLLSDDQYAIYIRGSQNLPAIPSAVRELEYPALKEMAAWAQTDGANHILFGQGSWDAVTNVCQAVLDGSMTPEAGAARIQADVVAARQRP